MKKPRKSSTECWRLEFASILCLLSFAGVPAVWAEDGISPKDDVVVIAPGDPPMVVVIEGWYCHDGTDSSYGQTPTEITRDFLNRLGNLLEVGVADKAGLMKRDLLEAKDRGVTAQRQEEAEERIKLSKKGAEEFWKRLLEAKTLTFKRSFTVDPPMGESRTIKKSLCYTLEDLKKPRRRTCWSRRKWRRS